MDVTLKNDVTLNNNATLKNSGSVRAAFGRLIAGLVVLVLLSGCTHTLIVDGSFPSPLVSKLPHTLGVHYPEEFTKYRYVEKSKDRAKWIIDMGEAQTDLFEAVLPGVFTTVTRVDELPADDPDATPPAVDLVIMPTVEEFQYTLPSETKIKVYEIWLKYNVQVYDPNGSLIADWILTAYGKTPTGFMQSDEVALNQAVVVALRDAGANLSLNFTNIPEVRAWLAQR
ncbi:MAG: hypothetical protein WDZ30_01460 [Cellvibrionaceae bacterium]